MPIYHKLRIIISLSADYPGASGKSLWSANENTFDYVFPNSLFT